MSDLRHFLVTATLVFLVSTHPYEASARVVKEGYGHDLVLQSLQRAKPTPPSQPNGCTSIPGTSGPPCIGGRAFAGHVMAPPPLRPDQMIPLNDAA
ncbi:hypothetical protein V6N13_044764 [Hibiscus sabdariffa]|uniref:Uncharacterized protein n=1 Tax=Hibiscus sabdariffa TaxID=183260 RepID=A0ABR2RJ28_9ROSI